MNILLPDPSLVLLIGVSGSGKSTFARRHFAATEIISSDHCRALICDDENNQAVNQEAFELVHWLATKRLARRKLTVIDATNVQPEARRFFLKLAQAEQVPMVAIVLRTGRRTALAQNAQRQRVVPQEIVQQQYAALQETLATLPAEGFQAIYVLRSAAQIQATKILRQ